MNTEDKNLTMVEFLSDCPAIMTGPLFFNYADEDGNSNHIVTVADDKSVQKPFVDGSVLKQYTFQLICYRPLSGNPLIGDAESMDENLENMSEVQKVLDWIEEQNDNRNYPDFGESCIPDKLYCLSDDPDLYAIDTESDPPLAKYAIVIRYEYLDKSKMIFN